MRHIRLHLTHSGWNAEFIDDATILAAFGTDTIPLAYTELVDRATVLAQVVRRHPGCVVSIASAPFLADSIHQ